MSMFTDLSLPQLTQSCFKDVLKTFREHHRNVSEGYHENVILWSF